MYFNMNPVIKIFAPLSLEVVMVYYGNQQSSIESIVNTFKDKGLYVTARLCDKVFTGAMDSEFENYLTNEFQKLNSSIDGKEK